MKKNDIRVTYAVDRQTVTSLESLARVWGVSKSEAMRRAVQIATEKVESRFSRMAPLEILDYCAKTPARSPKQTQKWQKEMREARKAWGE